MDGSLKIKLKTFISMIFLSALTGTPCLYSEYENSIIASVDGDPITLFDVVNETVKSEIRKSKVMSGEELRKEVFKNRKETVDDMIDRHLIYKEFKSKGYKIPPQYIESMIDEIAAGMAGGNRQKLIEKLNDAKIPYEEFKDKIYEKAAVDIMINEFCYRLVNITPEQVQRYYDENKSEFIGPPKLELQILYLDKNGKNKDKIGKLSEEIANDMKKADENIFSSLVKLYSEGPAREEGGKSGWIEDKNMRPEFKNALKEIKTGEKAGPIDTAEGTYFLRISGFVPQSEIPYQSVEDDIRKKLGDKERKSRYEEYTRKLREKAVVQFFFE